MSASNPLRNWKIAGGYGCFDAEGMSEMRQGKAPTIQRGTTYTGDQLSVDHIIPRAVCPELDNVIANLELMPVLVSALQIFSFSAFALIGSRQLQKAEELYRAGLLTAPGIARVRTAK